MTTSTAASSPDTLDDSRFTLTAAAQTKLAELLTDAGSDVAGVRIYVAGGGCGGINFGMTFAESVDENDTVLEGAGCRVLMDAMANSYLRGGELDFRSDGISANFVFNNVSLPQGGGCGGGGSGGCGGGSCGGM